MMRKAVTLPGLLLVAIVLTLSGCISVQSYRTTNPYVITHPTWWNYYQRGRLYLHDGNYALASKDFETALGRIPGARYPYTTDRWRVRTYGMHMLESYFPNRELGISLFYMNEPEEALRLLETSIKMEPSARAKFYINRIHEKLAEKMAPPPEIEVASLPNPTRERTVLLQGSATGSNMISHIEINGLPEFTELAEHQVAFRKEIHLKEGSNSIRIVALDVSGKRTSTNLTLTADWTPPEIYLHRNGSRATMEVQDNLGLQRIQINGQTVSTPDKKFTLALSMPTNQPLTLAAVDAAGNRTDWSLSAKELSHIVRNQKAMPPVLHLDNAGETVVQIKPEYELDIRAEDDTALRMVKLNGKNLLTRSTPLFRALRRIPLLQGTNHLDVVAEDYDGNRAGKQINVVYRQPEYLDKIYRLTAILSPLAGEIPDSIFAQRVDNLIEDDLTRVPVRFYLLAAGNDEARELQNEHKISDSKLADPRAMLAKGKKLDADLVFIARVLSDAPGQTVYAKVLDAHSDKELFIEDVYMENPALLPEQLDGLVMKIEQHFPLIQGRIQEMGNRLTINAGARNGACTGMRMLVIHSNGSFEQGHVVETGNRPAELVVSKIESNTSTVIMPPGQPRDSVHAGDYVFAR